MFVVYMYLCIHSTSYIAYNVHVEVNIDAVAYIQV